MIHDGMLYDPIKGQGQGHRGPEVVKVVDFKVYLFRQYVCDQKANGKLRYSKTILTL